MSDPPSFVKNVDITMFIKAILLIAEFVMRSYLTQVKSNLTQANSSMDNTAKDGGQRKTGIQVLLTTCDPLRHLFPYLESYIADIYNLASDRPQKTLYPIVNPYTLDQPSQ